MRYFQFIFCILYASISISQPITFEKKYGNANILEYIVPVDGGYFFNGTKNEFLFNHTKIAGMLDSLGNLVWYKEYYPQTSISYTKKAIKLNANWYIIGTDNVDSSYSATILKLNSNGDELDFFPLTNSNEGIDMIMSADSNIIFIGSDTLSDFVAKIDTAGNTIWKSSFLEYPSSYLIKMAAFDDSTFYIVGKATDSLFNNLFILLKYNSNGQLLWNRTIGDPTFGFIWDIATDNEHLFITGYNLIPFINQYRQFIYKADTSGQIVDSVVYVSQYSDYYQSLAVNNQHIYATGRTFNANSIDLTIAKFNTNLDSFWTRTYSTSEGKIIQTTPDGGLIIGGDCNNCLHFIKTDSMGCVVPGCYASIKDPKEDPLAVYLYPNPFHDYLVVDLPEGHSIAEIWLFDIVGRQVLHQKLDSSNNAISTTDLIEGVYIVRVQLTDGKAINRKLVKY